jgi:mono/diheme cytochrome c family protein
MMSYTNASRLSDDDTRAVIAYLRSLSTTGQQTATPPDHLSILGLLMLGAGLLPTGKPVAVVSAPPKAPTLQSGEYIMSYEDCRQCHGSKLAGACDLRIPDTFVERLSCCSSRWPVPARSISRLLSSLLGN